MGRESLVNAWWLALARGYGAAMRLVKLKEDAELLELFEDSARRIEAPMQPAQDMTEVLVSAADRVHEGMRALRGGEDVAATLVEIHRLEDEADRIVRGAVASLFVNGIDPMIVIRWKDIFETLESAVDACETVANVLEGITLKRGNGRH